ncbi:hypothetical protein [Sphingomonas sp.]|uniref:hypothetical protein n=1 Tax=Sphingomonas sp. TaxID=28214 RepID=UPI002DD68C35|nr:hypothetical protein [Sphingomonas sp.]
MRRATTSAVLLALLAWTAGGVSGAAATPPPPKKAAAKPAVCADGKPRKRGGFGRLLGSVAGGVASSAVGRAGGRIVAGLAGSTINLALTDALSCKLEPAERERAAKATNDVLEKPVGTTAAWSSDTRADVSGSSTLTAQNRLADGSMCKNVRDVATVNGEEMVISKRMCKAPGGTGYVMQSSAV